MDSLILYSLAGILLFCTGLYGVFFIAHLLKRLMAMNIMAAGVFLILIVIARRNAEAFPDPVPHAMLLTGIVVAVSATAFACAIARRYVDITGRTGVDEEDAS